MTQPHSAYQIYLSPNSGNTYCYLHQWVIPADLDCYACIYQRRCPHTPMTCDFYPANPGPSIPMYEEIKEHLRVNHSLNSDNDLLMNCCDDNIASLHKYD